MPALILQKIYIYEFQSEDFDSGQSTSTDYESKRWVGSNLKVFVIKNLCILYWIERKYDEIAHLP